MEDQIAGLENAGFVMFESVQNFYMRFSRSKTKGITVYIGVTVRRRRYPVGLLCKGCF